MTARNDSNEWLRLVAEAAGPAPDAPTVYAQQLAKIKRALHRRRRRQTVALAALGAASVAAAVVLAFGVPPRARGIVPSAPRHFEASAATQVPRRNSTQQTADHHDTPASTATEQNADPEDPVDSNELIDPKESTSRTVTPAPAPAPAPAPVVTASDLLERANEARAAHEANDARAALLELRKRFPSDVSAEQATFLLGRIEGELAGDTSAACVWFDRYIEEYPRGRFVAGARGRLLQTYAEGPRSNSARAESAARDYLAHHPQGSYAKLAHSVLKDSLASNE